MFGERLAHRRASVLCLLAGIVACGRIEFARLDASADATDAPLGAFAAPVLVAPLSHSNADDDPSATGDGLELYFMSARAPSTVTDIWISRRASRADPWEAPQQVTELNSTSEDQSPGVSPDGLTIYLSSRRPSPLGGTNSNIWVATRPTRADAWSPPVFVAELSSPQDEFEPQPDESGLRIALYRHLAGPDRDVLEATRATTADPWGVPVAIANTNTAGSERSPCFAAAALEMWLCSDRGSAQDVHDIYVATRASTAEAFSTPVPVPELNSAADDCDPWLSPDSRLVIFSSTRSGNAEVYEAQR